MMNPSTSNEPQQALVWGVPATFESVLRLPSPIDGVLSSNVSATEQLAIERSRNNAEVAKHVDLIDERLAKRLYHQFTESVEEYLFAPQFASCWSQDPQFAIAFLVHVVKPVTGKLNQLKLLMILRRVADTFKGLPALKFLEVWESGMRNNTNTLLLYRAIQAFHLLHGGFISECEEFLYDFLEPSVEKTFGLSGEAQAEFHRAAAAYCWGQQQLEKFYKHSMHYLEGTELSTLLPEDLVQLAQNLCRAVLLSPKIYSFTELLQHPVLDCISPGGFAHPDQAFLRDLVVICNSGDHQLFESFVQESAKNITPDLRDKMNLIEQKVTIFALLELAFQKPQRNRMLTFAEIAQTCRVRMEEVEVLLLKVMSHGLMHGSIDQVEQKVSFTSLQPRLLDQPKIQLLSDHFRTWAKQVEAMVGQLEGMAPELFATRSVLV